MEGRQDQVLVHHGLDLLINDVLPPMKYESAAAYRLSWGDWQPNTHGKGKFELLDLSIVSSNYVAFAHCFIQCGGTLPNEEVFDDLGSCNLLFTKSRRGFESDASTHFQAI